MPYATIHVELDHGQVRATNSEELPAKAKALLVLLPDEPAPTSDVSAFDLMKDGCGIIRSGVPDLATDPKHMEGFGR
jgi:hypothetical protein